MKKLPILLSFILFLSACGQRNKETNQEISNANGQEQERHNDLNEQENIREADEKLEQASLEDQIIVETPLIKELVKSPLVVKGQARGTWFFEASFPVRLIDSNNKELAISPAGTTESWMTEEFIPFEAALVFETPETETGTLILEKDNPSGLPEYAASLEIPVRFK